MEVRLKTGMPVSGLYVVLLKYGTDIAISATLKLGCIYDKYTLR